MVRKKLTFRSSLAIVSGYSLMLFTLVMILRFGYDNKRTEKVDLADEMQSPR